MSDGSEGHPQSTRVSPASEPLPRPGALRFESVFAAEFDYVLRSLRRLGVCPGDLDDVTHDVFVAVYRHLDDYDATRPLRPWLFGFALRMARDYRALARHQREVIGDDRGHDEHADDAPGADQELERKRSRELVLAALDSMDFDRRALLVMHDLDGQPVREIAATLEVPLNTAYSRLRLAREQVREAVQRLRPTRGER